MQFTLKLLSSLFKEYAYLFKQNQIPILQECLVPKLIEISLVLEKKMKMRKVYRQADKDDWIVF